MGAQKDVLPFFQAEPGMDIARLYFRKVGMQHLSHRASGDVCPLFRQAAVGKVASRVLAVGHVHVRYDVNDPAVGLLRQALVLAAVARLHVEDGDVQALGAYHAQAAVGVSEHEHAIRFYGGHQPVALGDDVAHSLAEIRTYCVHINFRFSKFEVAEEDSVEVVVVVLPGVGEDDVEVSAALADHSREADDLGTRADDYQQLEPAVILEMDVCVLGHGIMILLIFAFANRKSYAIFAM